MTATMASMSSSIVAAAAGLRTGTFAARSSPAAALAPQRRRALAVVRAAQRNKPDVVDSTTEETTTTSPVVEVEPNKPGLLDTLAFSGPGPERINGRLAMVGFVSALAVEASRGVGLLSQAGNGAGLTWFAYTAVVMSAASLAPLLQGESAEGRSGGIWTADAELWNGRAAMLGLVALAVTEYLTGSPLINA